MGASAGSTDWAKAVWEQGKKIDVTRKSLAHLALSFRGLAEQFPNIPTHTYRLENEVRFQYPHGLSNSARLELLFEWFGASQDQSFIDSALSLAAKPLDGLDPWADGERAVIMIGHLRDEDYYSDVPLAEQIAERLEANLILMIDAGLTSDVLENLSDAAERWRSLLNPDTIESIGEAIRSEVRHVEDVIADIDSESSLDSHAQTIRKLAKRSHVASDELERAIDIISDKIAELEERTQISNPPTVTETELDKSDNFDDLALKNLFVSLIRAA